MIATGEVFDRVINASKGKENSLDWIFKRWQETIEEDTFKPLGTDFDITKGSQDITTIFMNRDPLKQMNKESTVASLFNSRVRQGLILSAFLKEKPLINRSEIGDQPESISKTHALAKDSFEYKRIESLFTILKKSDGI